MKLLAFVAATGIGVLTAAPPQGQSRRLWDVQLLEQAANNQPSEAAQPAPKANPKPPPEPQEATGPIYFSEAPKPRPFRQQDALVGITVWRLRPAAPDDKAILNEADSGAQWTPVRVPPGERLSVGDRVRITIEAPRSGFLYVIDREMYTDGSVSAPFLIFPTRRVRLGDNKVEPGRLIEIPDRGDTPPYFRLEPRDAKYLGEKLTVIVAPKELPGVPLGRSYIELPADQVRSWESAWGGPAELFELQAPPGAVWTAAEQMAAMRSRLLVQEEPMPQSIYRVSSSPNEPLLVEVPLQVKDSRAAP